MNRFHPTPQPPTRRQVRTVEDRPEKARTCWDVQTVVMHSDDSTHSRRAARMGPSSNGETRRGRCCKDLHLVHKVFEGCAHTSLLAKARLPQQSCVSRPRIEAFARGF